MVMAVKYREKRVRRGEASEKCERKEKERKASNRQCSMSEC